MKQSHRILLSAVTAFAMGWGTAVGQNVYRVEAETTASVGDHSPLWLNANKYGLSSVDPCSAYLRVGVSNPLVRDSLRKVDFGYGIDMALAAGFTSTAVVQQAYAEAQWQMLSLTAGAKEYPLEMKDGRLSSGGQALGINARPVPQLRAAIPEYWSLPLTRGWVAFKGHLAYGMFTDQAWQYDFKAPGTRYTEGTLYHSKFGALRIGPKNITFEIGLEMACQFGGTSYQQDGTVIDMPLRLRSFVNALTAGGSDATDGKYLNSEGNHVGSWITRLNMDFEDFSLGIYGDQFFEDNSMMVHIAFNGYTTGDDSYHRSGSRYFVYDFSDGLIGAEVRLKRLPWLSNIVLEQMRTNYQGGPVYHDQTSTYAEHVCGRDNYYNHNIFTGWQHWGQVMGNPLYRSPLYNDNHDISVRDNRFIAWHLGLSGTPAEGLSYRLLASWQRSYGKYERLLPDPETNFSLMAEGKYKFRGKSRYAGWDVRAALGMDCGKLLGNNFGVQLTVARTGLISK